MANVAVVVFEDIFEQGGSTVAVYRVLEVLQKMGCSITVIASSDKNQNKLAGMDDVRIQSLGKKLLTYHSMPFPIKLVPILIWNLKLALILLKNRFDLVYCFWEFLGFPSVYLLSKVGKYKVVSAMDSIFSTNHEEAGHSGILLKLDRSLEKFVVKHSAHIIADGRSILEFYQAYNKRIDLVPLFIDIMLFRAIDRPKSIDSIVIGLIGPFDTDIRGRSARKFLYDRVNDFDSRIKFVMIGQCNNRIRHDRISYTGYLDSVRDYADQLCNLNAVLVAEAYATTGPLTKIIQAMSCSLPVFATPKAFVGFDYAEPGRDIFVFDENEMVERINELIFNAALMSEVGRNARKVVEQYYSKKANEHKLFKILQSVLER